MKRWNKWMACVAAVVAMSACGDDDPTGNNANGSINATTGNNGSTNNATTGNNGSTNNATTGNNGSTSNACTPITECAPEQCGTVDDGCGGTVQCETECGCIDGDPQSETCGSCGLGVLECAPSETGPGTCIAPAIPNLEDIADTCEESIIYVDASASAGDGSRENPFNSMTSLGADPGMVVVISATQASPLQETIDVEDGVHIVGGYDSDWVYDPEGRAVIRPLGEVGEDHFGVKVEGLTEETFISNLDVATEDATNGRSNYGLYVRATDTLTVYDSDFFAGEGGKGTDGQNGQNGTDGLDGADGTRGQSTGGSGGPGAAGGTNPGCPTADGGDGGDGMTTGQAGTYPAEDGVDAESAIGGEAGEDRLNAYGGGEGEDGPTISSSPTEGARGVSTGRVSGGLWVPEGDGGMGADGQHGSGGAGGGGAWRGEFVGSAGQMSEAGPGGAGGGAGGCGGQGGTGGEGGGGSFGLFALSSRVNVERTSFIASSGGDGGAAGFGGAGGLAGAGGVGTNEAISQSFGMGLLAFSSGDGGDGADGQVGGDGGGGAGGVSFGAFCDQSRIISSVATDVEFEAGTPARGGRGAGSADGEDGDIEDIQGCAL